VLCGDKTCWTHLILNLHGFGACIHSKISLLNTSYTEKFPLFHLGILEVEGGGDRLAGERSPWRQFLSDLCDIRSIRKV
jgi:hypothetical protein